ncbi:MAG: RidA family protein [Cellvibrionales bacterium]|nr:RidA family protein [Cellvibrionales bacterium]
MGKNIIQTDAAPAAIGPYSQAVRAGDTLYISGQIPLIPGEMTLIDGDICAQTDQVFKNLSAIADAAGGSLNDAVKINISLTDLANFDAVNAVMKEYLNEPYPARACVQVVALPKAVDVEIEAILYLAEKYKGI